MKLSLKDAAKRNQVDVCKILAKEVAQSRKAVNKLYASKAQINSVMMSMDQQLCKSSVHLVNDTHEVATLSGYSRILFAYLCLQMIAGVLYDGTKWKFTFTILIVNKSLSWLAIWPGHSVTQKDTIGPLEIKYWFVIVIYSLVMWNCQLLREQ